MKAWLIPFRWYDPALATAASVTAAAGQLADFEPVDVQELKVWGALAAS